MLLANEKEVRSILTSDRETRIAQAYRLAWTDWWNNPARQRLNTWSRTRANNLFEYLFYHLKSEFKDDPRTRFFFERETFKLIIEEELVIRFKKSNSHGVGSNIGTQAEFDFCDPQTELPGLPGLHKVEIVYSLNVTQSAIDQITVLARNGDRRLWSYNIMGSSESALAQLVPPRSPVSDSDIDRMVMPKKVNKSAKEGGT